MQMAKGDPGGTEELEHGKGGLKVSVPDQVNGEDLFQKEVLNEIYTE